MKSSGYHGPSPHEHPDIDKTASPRVRRIDKSRGEQPEHDPKTDPILPPEISKALGGSILISLTVVALLAISWVGAAIVAAWPG